MDRPRGVDIFDVTVAKKPYGRLTDEYMGSVTSVHAFHPSLPLVAGANSSGRVYLWSMK
jgi:hypothetical protein